MVIPQVVSSPSLAQCIPQLRSPFAVCQRSVGSGVTHVPACLYQQVDVRRLAGKVVKLAAACNLLSFQSLETSAGELGS